MADLTLEQVQTNGGLPAGSFSVTGGVAVINVGTLIGESVTTLTNECITELCYKLLRACRRTQVVVNQNLVAPNRIDAFAAPTESAPVEVDSQLFVTSTVSCRARMPVNLNDVVAPVI